jgi:hypothetical protein
MIRTQQERPNSAHVINTCVNKQGDLMSIKLLEHVRDELKRSGAVQNTPEFCRSWLGRSEGYIRTLRHHHLEPSVATLAVCANKLDYYAQHLKGSDEPEHQAFVARFEGLKGLCDQAIAKQAQAVWREPARMGI